MTGMEASGSISMAFGSPWDREIPLLDVQEIVDAYLAVGVTEISLSGASGQAHPTQVYQSGPHAEAPKAGRSAPGRKLCLPAWFFAACALIFHVIKESDLTVDDTSPGKSSAKFLPN